MTLGDLKNLADSGGVSEKMPVVFFGHGSPMNGIEDNQYSRAWIELGTKLPRPRAILSISAHWLTEGTRVHVAEKPKTIHDFWGFPKELYNLTYPCAGSPEVAHETQKLVGKTEVAPDNDWGVDHGTWIVLHRVFPKADIPVFQMSIDYTKDAAWHYELGRELAGLRRRGVLIIGSGNIVHNLGIIDFDPAAKPRDWALEFDDTARILIEQGNHKALMEYEKLGHAADLAIPTPDHYWPLMYILALQEKDESLSYPIDGIAHGSVSMRTITFGS